MKIIDLTMPLDENTPTYPGEDIFKQVKRATIKKEGYNISTLTFTSHFATHIDAPFHLNASGKKLHEYPVDKFLGSAIVIPLEKYADYLNLIKKDDIVFIYTGIEKEIKREFTKSTYILSEDLARSLVDKEIKIVGVDAHSPDNPPFNIHPIFLDKDILIVENLVNIKPLVGKRFECTILPLKIMNGDGAPCRVIASISENQEA